MLWNRGMLNCPSLMAKCQIRDSERPGQAGEFSKEEFYSTRRNKVLPLKRNNAVYQCRLRTNQLENSSAEQDFRHPGRQQADCETAVHPHSKGQ